MELQVTQRLEKLSDSIKEKYNRIDLLNIQIQEILKKKEDVTLIKDEQLAFLKLEISKKQYSISQTAEKTQSEEKKQSKFLLEM